MKNIQFKTIHSLKYQIKNITYYFSIEKKLEHEFLKT